VQGGQVRTLEETEQLRGIHQLIKAEGGKSQETKRERQGGTHKLSSTEGRYKSGHRTKSVTEGTHKLISAEGGSGQESERSQVNEGHSLPVECRGRDKSGC